MGLKSSDKEEKWPEIHRQIWPLSNKGKEKVEVYPCDRRN